MSAKSKHLLQEDGAEEFTDSAQFLNNLRLKVFVGFIAALMVLYSFFGSIYRVPMQMEQFQKDVVTMKATDEDLRHHINEIEKLLAAKEDLFSEVSRTRARVEVIERMEASRVAMQQQLDRLEGVTKDLTRLLDSTSIRLTELNANMSALKETSVETKRALEDIKRKSP